MVCTRGTEEVETSPGLPELLSPKRGARERRVEQGGGALTLRLLRWMSPMELATVFGPRSMRVLRGHSVLTRWCSPIRILRTFSAPVTRISGRPSKCVLNTLPYFSLREDWKPEPCGSHNGDLSEDALLRMRLTRGPASRTRGGGRGGWGTGHTTQGTSTQTPAPQYTSTRVSFIFQSKHKTWEVGPRG